MGELTGEFNVQGSKFKVVEFNFELGTWNFELI
jgi:hypothetical protein